ncbi:hypothetical protein [Actinoplanes sp. NPDC051851]|uniref:hypothetical protein n=1 Tax=Actinoplanes sp. NPDC051851 TaxID=3154753 RepID=UPI00342E5A00
MSTGPSAGVRPRLHFLPRDGWVGDLFGVLRVEGRYHLFYEHRSGNGTPGGWGRAVSDDLVIWREQPVVAAPGAGPRWCGSVVDGVRGPVLFFGRTGEGVFKAEAASGLGGWSTGPDAVIAGELGDPYVFGDGDGGWRMIVAGAGGVLQYRSVDLESWDYDGVLVERDGASCPRLFPLAGAWVLLLGNGDVIEYAVGDYDGRTFTPLGWDVFGRGDLGPAATFVDDGGRRVVLARLGSDEGTLSVPWILSVHGGRLLATPHPHLDRYLISGISGLSAARGEVRDHGEVILRMPVGGETLVLADAGIVEVTVEGVSGLGAASRVVPGDPGAHIARFA